MLMKAPFPFYENFLSTLWDFGSYGTYLVFIEEEEEDGKLTAVAGQALCRPFPFWPADKAEWQGGGERARQEKKTSQGREDQGEQEDQGEPW